LLVLPVIPSRHLSTSTQLLIVLIWPLNENLRKLSCMWTDSLFNSPQLSQLKYLNFKFTYLINCVNLLNFLLQHPPFKYELLLTPSHLVHTHAHMSSCCKHNCGLKYVVFALASVSTMHVYANLCREEHWLIWHILAIIQWHRPVDLLHCTVKYYNEQNFKRFVHGEFMSWCQYKILAHNIYIVFALITRQQVSSFPSYLIFFWEL
jgi:hypothetical protein